MPDAAQPKYLTFRFVEAEGVLFARFAPQGGVERISPDDFRRAASEAGCGGYRFNERAVIDAVEKYNMGLAFDAMVAEAVDGDFIFRIDNEHMAAYLKCMPPQGGDPVERKAILEDAERRGIGVELDIAAIEKALSSGEEVLVAQGKEAVHGKDGRVEVLIPNMSNRSPHLDEHGLADFRDLGEVVTVHAGEQLLRHIPPTEGVPGMALSGKSLPARKGKDVPFATKLDGAAIDTKDPNVLIATIDGHPVVDKTEVMVEPIYTVKNVDLRTGNVAFKGTVHVTEDVHTGMTVRASGDILVDGTVEGATLEAGGDIVVKGGILGESEHTDHPHSRIQCGGACTARFVQNAHVSAGNGIFIHDYVMQGELTAGHQVVVGDKGSRKGSIIGGVTRAAMLVKAIALGSENGVKTVIVVGADRSLHERLKAIGEELKAAEHKLEQILKLLGFSLKHPGRVPEDGLHAAEATRDGLNVEMERLREEAKEVQAEIDLANDAQAIAESKVYAGVEVHFGVQCQKTAADRQGGIFRLSEGELVFE